MTDARRRANERIFGGDAPTVVTDSAALRSLEIEAAEAARREARQRELLKLAMVRGLMAMNANSRAMFLHHAKAASYHIAQMGVD